MVKLIIDNREKNFQWVDVTAPSEDEIHDLAEKYKLAAESVEDVLQPEHLPKHEKLSKYDLVILRMYNVTRESDADTVRELTNKVAIFVADHFVLTVHKHPWEAINNLAESAESEFNHPEEILFALTHAALASFDEASARLSRTIDYFEEHVFLKDRKTPLLKSLYFLKRKVDVMRGLLIQTKDVVEYVDPPQSTDAVTRNIRDLYVRQLSVFNNLAENTNHLLGIYFNISAQRTNETIRVLTIFSVFFMPLTFLVGVYGMNFDFMPELRYKWGYPIVWMVMILIVIIIYIWFQKKKWL